MPRCPRLLLQPSTFPYASGLPLYFHPVWSCGSCLFLVFSAALSTLCLLSIASWLSACIFHVRSTSSAGSIFGLPNHVVDLCFYCLLALFGRLVFCLLSSVCSSVVSSSSGSLRSPRLLSSSAFSSGCCRLSSVFSSSSSSRPCLSVVRLFLSPVFSTSFSSSSPPLLTSASSRRRLRRRRLLLLLPPPPPVAAPRPPAPPSRPS